LFRSRKIPRPLWVFSRGFLLLVAETVLTAGEVSLPENHTRPISVHWHRWMRLQRMGNRRQLLHQPEKIAGASSLLRDHSCFDLGIDYGDSERTRNFEFLRFGILYEPCTNNFILLLRARQTTHANTCLSL